MGIRLSREMEGRRDAEDKTGKVLGVLGGMGLRQQRNFAVIGGICAVAERDQDHPQVIMLGDTQLADRSTAMLGEGESPLEPMREDFLKLVQWGADVLCSPCNSAHYFIDQSTANCRCRWYIVDATLAEAQELSPKRPLLLNAGNGALGDVSGAGAGNGLCIACEPLPVAGELAEQSLREIKGGIWSGGSDVTHGGGNAWEEAPRRWYWLVRNCRWHMVRRGSR